LFPLKKKELVVIVGTLIFVNSSVTAKGSYFESHSKVEERILSFSWVLVEKSTAEREENISLTVESSMMKPRPDYTKATLAVSVAWDR
jgi:hypothetical protein